MISRNPSKRGFTLIELLVVISIIGLLVAVAAVSFSSTQVRARNSRRMQDLESWQKAMEQAAGLSTANLYPTSAPTGFVVPTDPINQSVNGIPYQYSAFFATTSYCICARLEGAAGTNISGANATAASTNATSCPIPTNPATAGTLLFYCVQNQQ